MFADDTTIYFIGKGVEEIIDALNLILNNLKVIKSFCSEKNIKRICDNRATSFQFPQMIFNMVSFL